MAWIEWEKGLELRVEVTRIAQALNISKYEVAGRMMALWAWVDGETATGWIAGATRDIIDTHFGMPGAAAAIEACGWMKLEDGGVRFSKFHRHHSMSARARTRAAERARRYRRKRKGKRKTRRTAGKPAALPPPPKHRPGHSHKPNPPTLKALCLEIDRGEVVAVNGHRVTPGDCRVYEPGHDSYAPGLVDCAAKKHLLAPDALESATIEWEADH